MPPSARAARTSRRVLGVGQVETLHVLLVEPGPGRVERDAAAGQDRQPLGDAELAPEAVRGPDQRAAAGLVGLQSSLPPLARALVQPGERLVAQEPAPPRPGEARAREAAPHPGGV